MASFMQANYDIFAAAGNKQNKAVALTVHRPVPLQAADLISS